MKFKTIPKQKDSFSTFFDTGTSPPFELCETFFQKIFNVSKGSLLQFLIFRNKMDVKKPQRFTPKGFRYYDATYWRHFLRRNNSIILKIIFCFFLRFSVEQDGFFCCFQLRKGDFRVLCVSLRVFFGTVPFAYLR